MNTDIHTYIHTHMNTRPKTCSDEPSQQVSDVLDVFRQTQLYRSVTNYAQQILASRRNLRLSMYVKALHNTQRFNSIDVHSDFDCFWTFQHLIQSMCYSALDYSGDPVPPNQSERCHTYTTRFATFHGPILSM